MNVATREVLGKLHGRVLIERVGAGTECAIGEEQCGFRQGRGCMDKCLPQGRFVKRIYQTGKMYSERLWICKRHMIRSIGMVCGRC